jgi:hypothetical protein
MILGSLLDRDERPRVPARGEDLGRGAAEIRVGDGLERALELGGVEQRSIMRPTCR